VRIAGCAGAQSTPKGIDGHARHHGAREGWIPVSTAPPVPIRAMLSARPDAALGGRFPGVFGTDLLTGLPRRRRKIALRRPSLSGPADLGVSVRNSKT
jgi:hypothetical protein